MSHHRHGTKDMLQPPPASTNIWCCRDEHVQDMLQPPKKTQRYAADVMTSLRRPPSASEKINVFICQNSWQDVLTEEIEIEYFSESSSKSEWHGSLVPPVAWQWHAGNGDPPTVTVTVTDTKSSSSCLPWPCKCNNPGEIWNYIAAVSVSNRLHHTKTVSSIVRSHTVGVTEAVDPKTLPQS